MASISEAIELVQTELHKSIPARYNAEGRVSIAPKAIHQEETLTRHEPSMFLFHG